ncbi:tetratricopeptide repeat protein [Neorhodopirellula pilleata]|uniref:Tetratricopeptide repeat protein n=1 Tax=Neorhodopirellula pilleata TaxID=2714738 RepID=A0A5C5ZWA8_9BACT|nr:hypothetical protein [Neorhodopirellula pilleata]TWT91874.1 hypothetical protein Pla100_49120 [Neorhodopirellula pilleata]
MRWRTFECIWAVGIIGCGLLGCGLAGCQNNEVLYPPSPFEHVADGFPEIIPLREEPSPDDEAAYEDYWNTIAEVSENSLERTILAQGSQQEKDLFIAVEEERYAEARTLADAILRESPDSIVGLYAMARVEAFAESDMAYALNSIRAARRQAEAMADDNPHDPIGQEWYIRILSTEWDILTAMDRSEEVLMAADRIEQVYAPVPWLKTFAWIKLEKFDEARAEVARYQGLGQYDIDASNSLMIIEDKLKSRESSLQAARQMCERFPNQRVLQNNLGYAAIFNASFGEAEQAFLAAADATESPMNSSPYVPLSAMLVQQGRFPEALDAIKKAQVDRGDREPYTLHDDEANTNLAIASVLLAYNESELAMRFARRATESPDRAASTSNSSIDLSISDALILWTIQKYEREQLQEQLSIGSVPVGKSLSRIASLQASLWTTKQRLTSELNGTRLVDLVSPYKPGGVGIESQVQSWHRFLLLDLVPLGVLEVALNQAEQAEQQPWMPPYFQALRAGVRLRQGDESEALRLADAALVDLPPRAEKLYRAFVATIAGQAAWQLDQPQVAIDHWSTTLRDFPQAFRLLDIAVPIRLNVQNGEREQAIASCLASSSRFFEHDQGCEINVRPFDGGQLLIEMFRNDRSRHMELLVPFSSEDGFIETTVDAFHQKFFQPLVELTQGDLGSLDGSPVAARMRRDVDQLFSDFILTEESKAEPDAP